MRQLAVVKILILMISSYMCSGQAQELPTLNTCSKGHGINSVEPQNFLADHDIQCVLWLVARAVLVYLNLCISQQLGTNFTPPPPSLVLVLPTRTNDPSQAIVLGKTWISWMSEECGGE